MNVPYLQSISMAAATFGRPGLHHPTIAPYGAYRCGDGRHAVVLDPERA